MKGQSLVFEQVMLFGISVAIFLIAIAVFDIYQNSYLSFDSVNHLDETTEWISSNIVKVAEKEHADSSLIIPIPRYVGDSVYDIYLNQNGLGLIRLLSGEEKNSTLFTLNETFLLSGSVNSIKGKITIKKEGRQIIIV